MRLDTAPNTPRIESAQTNESSRLPSLDGWRAISIAIVLLDHAHFAVGFPREWWHCYAYLPLGRFGVRMFFVISGLLITWLLLREAERCGRVSLKDFYIRRALRILPVCFAFLFVIACAQVLTPFQQSPTQWIANLTFTTNCFKENPITGHFWSLAVEEQFYLIWPPLFVFASLAFNPRKSILLLLIPIIGSAIVRVLNHVHAVPHILEGFTSYYATIYCVDALAIGCIAAILLARFRRDTERLITKYPLLLVCGSFVLMMVPHFLSRSGRLGLFTVPFAQTSQSVGVVVLILMSVVRPQWFAALNWRWVKWVGVLSYSIYVWHQPFWHPPETFGLGNVWWMTSPGWLVPSFATAILSYYLLEKPLFKLRAKFRAA